MVILDDRAYCGQILWDARLMLTWLYCGMVILDECIELIGLSCGQILLRISCLFGYIVV